MKVKLSHLLTPLALSLALAGFSVALYAAGADPGSDAIASNDKDHDQTLDLSEVKASASAHFDRLDKDGDHTLEDKELKGVLGMKAFKQADIDHDGTLSKDEYLAVVERLFNKADRDHDGTLDADELKALAARSLRRLID